MIRLSRQDGKIIGTLLSGTELFHAFDVEPVTLIGVLRLRIAATLQACPSTINLLHEGNPVDDCEAVGNRDLFVARQFLESSTGQCVANTVDSARSQDEQRSDSADRPATPARRLGGKKPHQPVASERRRLLERRDTLSKLQPACVTKPALSQQLVDIMSVVWRTFAAAGESVLTKKTLAVAAKHAMGIDESQMDTLLEQLVGRTKIFVSGDLVFRVV
jgi:hypothetical protein